MIYIIIPVHNRIDVTLDCLRCIYNQSYKDFKVIVVDDGSTDGSTKKISLKYPEVTLLYGDGNLWWAGAIVEGVNYILKTASIEDYVLTINNDQVFESDYFDSLITIAKNHPKTLIGSLCKNYSEKEKFDDTGVKVLWNPYHYELIKYQKGVDGVYADALSGRGTLIPMTVFKKIGNFDAKHLPHYGADYEFSMRAKKNGFKLFVSYGALTYNKSEYSGINVTGRYLSLKEYSIKMFNIKSPSNIKNIFWMVWLNAPNFYSRIFNVIYILAGYLYSFLINMFSYYIFSKRNL